MRGVGEPLWVGRGRQEAIECHRHEWLLPRAFAEDPLLWLVCPYDASGLDAADVDLARRLHPGRLRPDRRRSSSTAVPGPATTVSAAPTSRPSRCCPSRSRPTTGCPTGRPPGRRPVVRQRRPGRGAGRGGRRCEGGRAGAVPGQGADPRGARDRVQRRHGTPGGTGRLRVWASEAGAGRAGRRRLRGRRQRPRGRSDRRPDGRPGAAGDRLDSGRGLWLANQLCDLVQLRTSASRDRGPHARPAALPRADPPDLKRPSPSADHR